MPTLIPLISYYSAKNWLYYTPKVIDNMIIDINQLSLKEHYKARDIV